MEINKEYLINEYTKKRRSMKKIGRDFNVSAGTIMRAIHRYNIPINKYPKAWNSNKTYLDDPRILAKNRHPRNKNTIYYNSDFKRIKKEIFPCNCNRCRNIAKVLHHIDNNKMNNDIINLEPLCASCHSILHNKMRGITIYKHNCEWCYEEFIIKHNKKCKQRFCSLSCKAKFHYHKEDSLFKKRNLR